MTHAMNQDCVMGFDFGEKRIGVAVTNQATTHTQPLVTVTSKAGEPNWRQLTQLVTTWQPALFIVGKTNGIPDTLQKRIARFANQLQERYQCPVDFVEEAYSSTEAKYHLNEQRRLGLARKNQVNSLDKIAAALILDTWLGLKVQNNNNFDNIMQLEVAPLLKQVGANLKDALRREKIDTPLLVGIRTGGVWLAIQLQQMLGLSETPGELNIHFYRDDFSRVGLHPKVGSSNLPVPVEDQHIILVDDVLYTGRTIRAALNEIFDYGRPASVKLVVLIDRGGRELPIAADITGKKVQLSAQQNIKLHGPEPLQLTVS